MPHRSIFGKQKLVALAKQKRHFIFYSVIGASGALVDYIAFIILFNLIGINPFLSNMLSVSIGITNNFILNSVYNFQIRDTLLHRFISFYVVGLLGLLLSLFIIYIAHSKLGVDANIAKALSIPIIVIVQYVLNARFSFGDAQTVRKIFSKKNIFTLLLLVAFYVLFVSNVTYFGFADEYDNILGGWLISEHGQVVYRDFFSHHMPLPYFVSSLVTFFTENDLGMFRLVFVSGLFIWLLFICQRIYTAFGKFYAFGFLSLVTLSQYFLWSHMMLAETLIAYSTIHCLLILFFDFDKRTSLPRAGEIFIFGLLASIPALSALSYAPISVVLYLALLAIVLKKILPFDGKKALKTTRYVATSVALLAVPYITLLTYLVSTRSLNQFIEQAYVFNKYYYSQFTDDVPSGNVPDAILSMAANFFDQIARLYTDNFSVFAFSSLLLVTLLLSLLLIKRCYLFSSTLLIIFVTVTSRNDILAVAFQSPPVRYSAYGFLIIFCGLLIVNFTQIQTKKSFYYKDLLKAALFSAFIVGLGLIASGLSTALNIRENKTSGIQTGLELNDNGGHVASVVNRVANEGDYYWIGPFDFYTQLYVNAKRSSVYTFFAPWHGVCDKCSDDMISSFTHQKPLVVYWQPDVKIWNLNTDDYSQQIVSYLESNYYRHEDPAYANFYFRSDERTKISNRLEGDYYE